MPLHHPSHDSPSRAGEDLWLALGLLLVVVADALAVRAGWTGSFDRQLMLALRPPIELVPALGALTWLGDGLARGLVTAAAAVSLLALRDRRRAMALVAIVVVGAALDSAIKLVVARPRPQLLPHLDHVTSFSFPSGHAANGAILYVSLALLVPACQRTAGLVAAALLVLALGLSRIALAVHWPSDVLAGWALGLAWVLLWRRFPRAARSRLTLSESPSIARPCPRAGGLRPSGFLSLAD